ncbi:MAG: hypothetical protein QNJ14_06190 [Woeseiaceae bacterium]|nr:hypothetical protein [Woeseiaceae bacterium]
MNRTSAGLHRQRGAALLLLMLGVILATATVLVATVNVDTLKQRRQALSLDTLGQARAALLDYALVSARLTPSGAHGLPCPDIDSTGGFLEGEAHTSACGVDGETVIGRLPWRTLGLPPLKDGSAECLWYVVSGSWKHAAGATAPMINADTNGQIQMASVDTGLLLAGAAPEDRPVAAIIAAMTPVDRQSRPAATAGMQCSDPLRTSDYLEDDSGSGSSNSALLGSPDVIDRLGLAAEANELHNDRIALISRGDIADRIHASPGFRADMRSLGLAAAACIAEYAASNPGGVTDRRMPWPAPVALPDYRQDNQYDDSAGAQLAGRLADIVDDSNSLTANTISRVLSDCDAVAVPQWTTAMQARWQHWKDHFFYAVAGSFAPTAVVPSICSDCLTVNGAGNYAAIIIFGNRRLALASQVRNAPPLDADTRSNSANYLEAANAANVPGAGVLRNYVSQAASPAFNDLLFCIDDNLVVAEC